MTDETEATDAPTPSGDPLVIRYLEFLGGMASTSGWRPTITLPEIAFAGRSNVGKSSLLNRLMRRKSFARVSNTPGRTREINFFEVNKRFVLADLPGYGYAKVSKTQRAEWRPLIEGYLKRTTRLAGVVLLLDARHDPTGDDHQMLDFLASIEVPTVVVLTKIDKLTAKEGAQRVTTISNALQLEESQIVPFSATTGRGRDELAEALVSLLESVEAERADAARALALGEIAHGSAPRETDEEATGGAAEGAE